MLFTHECVFEKDGNTKIRRFAKDPAVAFFADRYFMYFSTLDEIDENKFRIGIATSKNLEDWEFEGLISLEGSVEEKGIAAPAVFVRNGKLHLFYQTYGNREKDAICHAVSMDGFSFERDASNPIFAPSTTWCCGRAIDADVIEYKDKLLLYFATRDKDFEVQMLGAAQATLDSDYSKNTWQELTQESILFPELAWEKKCIEAPATILVDDRIFLFYGGAYNCEPQQIGLSVSDDGIHFKRQDDKPFMTNGRKDDWNSCESGHPYVYKAPDGRVILFYQGSSDNGQSWYLSNKDISSELLAIREAIR